MGTAAAGRGLRAQPPAAEAVVRGRVVDAGDGRPVAAALVALRPAGGGAGGAERTARTDGEGRFAVRAARGASGAYTVAVRRLGYAPAARALRLPADTALGELRLAAAAVDLAPVAVTTPGRARSADELFQPAAVLAGAALDRALTTSVAATVAQQPGVWVRTNGPVAAQPVIRGLGGDRVAVLEDGQRTGDVATTAPDHAVTVDPLSARRVEVVRGPAALLYGSNVLGGVVNVVREDVPRAVPERPSGFLAGQGESVNAGGAAAGGVSAPLGRAFAARAFGTRRVAGDTRTPLGRLPFTDLDAWDAGGGLAWLPGGGARGYAGVAARDVRSDYGVPSSFGGRTLPGAHDGGVYVTLRRTTARADAEWRPRGDALGAPPARGVTGVAASGTYVRFAQDELERGGIVGTRFGQLSAGGDVVARVAHGGRVPGEGAVGVTGQWRDFRATGSFTGTRPAVVRAAGAYAYDELRLGGPNGRWRLLAGARVDRQQVRPLDSTETRLLAGVRTRDFAAVTGALAASVRLAEGVTLGAGVARAFRPPAVEELFSAGPHLATYAYEVGNPALRAERGRGVDAFLRADRRAGAFGTVRGELAGYVMAVRDFVFQAPVVEVATGAAVRDPRLRRYPVYQATQADARLTGAELSAAWSGAGALAGWAVEAGAAFVRGTRVSAVRLAPAVGVGGTLQGSTFALDADRAPLPAMPPARLRLALRRDRPRWFAQVGGEAVARQARVPGLPGALAEAASNATCAPRAGAGDTVIVRPAEFCPTPGRTLLDASAGVRVPLGGRLHALTLAGDNLLDAVWRDPLWRAKQVAVQPGRNLRLLYRVEF